MRPFDRLAAQAGSFRFGSPARTPSRGKGAPFRKPCLPHYRRRRHRSLQGKGTPWREKAFTGWRRLSPTTGPSIGPFGPDQQPVGDPEHHPVFLTGLVAQGHCFTFHSPAFPGVAGIGVPGPPPVVLWDVLDPRTRRIVFSLRQRDLPDSPRLRVSRPLLRAGGRAVDPTPRKARKCFPTQERTPKAS